MNSPWSSPFHERRQLARRASSAEDLASPFGRNPSDFSRILATGYGLLQGLSHDISSPLHIVWAPKYLYKVFIGDVRLRVREIIRQVCAEMGVTIINGALSRDLVHMFVEIPPHVSVNNFVRRAKGRSSRKIQQEFAHIRKRYWGQRFWGRGYFSTTVGNITEGVVMAYLDRHIAKEASAPLHDPTGISQYDFQWDTLPGSLNNSIDRR
ncbi:MAG: IS200/IS605 family transposase [Usitatibacteraceae bacterium]